VTISSTATTAAVTARSVMLASLIALVMSAMKAGPPVTCTVRSVGAPAVAEVRSAVITSRSANPERPAASGTGATAARPSCDAVSGGLALTAARDSTRRRASSAAPKSAGVSRAPSRRDATRIAGCWSAPGKSFNNVAALADSAEGGSCSGGLSAPEFGPTIAMQTPAPPAIRSAIIQERRCVTAAATRSHTPIPER
jgi:hypothetical protein